ncbi:hypothetical protein TARUN_5822 [Trichoderma arundinaceum]|uniref:Secreted protein n=1 Tax=Trichoderma arundinaceum TaxID=490622 RepID=A0A395NK58_TRIAR|nr:hypothetical protein TARUN_5822 [Trichoderma arundinaceum]
MRSLASLSGVGSAHLLLALCAGGPLRARIRSGRAGALLALRPPLIEPSSCAVCWQLSDRPAAVEPRASASSSTPIPSPASVCIDATHPWIKGIALRCADAESTR